MNNVEIFNELFEAITGSPAVIVINQELYPKPEWAIKQEIRIDGIVEDICKCGVGHPNKGWLKIYDLGRSKKFHYCCGCCQG